ncbi:MAG: hypothetical protein M3N47_02485 [Chloroflexota bacterium]|nr:hypothetical protein [Chloroflexota bacterium]
MNVSPNRVVAIATPLLFAPLAGTVAALAAKYAPGLEIDQGQLEAVFIAGATIAVAKAGLWLKGWQDYEKRQEAMRPVAIRLGEPMAHPPHGERRWHDEGRRRPSPDAVCPVRDEARR